MTAKVVQSLKPPFVEIALGVHLGETKESVPIPFCRVVGTKKELKKWIVSQVDKILDLIEFEE